ncbi:cold-shock protein [Nocardia aurea]|uniref:cold-shock protein n=1 Tax=Nocardia aurea TaxID=2144174 RepID=UPI0018E57D7F
MQGTVKWFDETKHFGFIAAADGSADLLVESKDIPDEFRHLIEEGCPVDFRVVVGMKGPQAQQVQPSGVRFQSTPAPLVTDTDEAAAAQARCA